jgi:GMP synthase (glutamine-hydrolysing)
MVAANHELLLILDFGSQYTQLIARRVREVNVYSEIVPFNISLKDIKDKNPKAIILSGGPASVHEKNAHLADFGIFELGIPILGICYGLQFMTQSLGGIVEPSNHREYGKTRIRIAQSSVILNGVDKDSTVWMSHGDKVKKLAPGFKLKAETKTAVAVIEDESRNFFGLQFHPEVMHTQDGTKILNNFIVDISAFSGDWTMKSFIEAETKRIRDKVGNRTVITALSGGVDSSVAASLVAKAIGPKQHCILVDTGLLRLNEAKNIMKAYKNIPGLKVELVDASKRFLAKLKGVSDPEVKRKIIGKEFIDVFQDIAKKIKNAEFLVQGTLYPDVIESVSIHGPSASIKSHHNVGGLPETLHMNLIEPLRELFKDEVREVGRELGLPVSLVNRHPFPGPGLAVRILGDITYERVRLLQQADKIVISEIKQAGIYDEIWQAFSVLLPVNTVGVMGDFRTYEAVLAIRAVTSTDGMTADWYEFPPDVLKTISTRVVNEVKGINRVVYDITSKPPGTIEWE